MSVKPFGCMPSSGVSDGVQSLITNRFPGTIFCAVETSGDGATNFYSRVQMYMFKARLAAAEELRKTYADCGVTEEEVRAFLAKNPKYASPFHHAPHTVAGSAANLIHQVAPLIKLSRVERATISAKKSIASAKASFAAAPGKAKALVAWVKNPETHEMLREDVTLVRDLLGGKVKERFGPMVARLAGKAYFENNPEVSHVNEPEVAIAAEE